MTQIAQPLPADTDPRLKAHFNPWFKLFIAALCAAIAAFVYLFFYTGIDSIFDIDTLTNISLVLLPVIGAGFIITFIAGAVILFKNFKIPTAALAAFIIILAAQTGAKLLLPEHIPIRPVDEAQMVVDADRMWLNIRNVFITKYESSYSPFRPHAHPLMLRVLKPVGRVTFGSASVANVLISALILLAVFLLCCVIFENRPWLAVACVFILAINPIFIAFTTSADYSVTALFASLSADMFTAAHLRKKHPLFLPAAMLALAFTVQTRPEYILYPAVVVVYLFVMAPPQVNRRTSLSLTLLLLALPHFLVLCWWLKNQPIVNYFNDPDMFTSDSIFVNVIRMIKGNLPQFPAWLTHNGTTVFIYAASALGAAVCAAKYRIQGFILVLPVAVLFFGVIAGNTQAFHMTTYSINFQPYLSIFAGVGFWTIAGAPKSRAARAATACALAAAAIVSSSITLHGILVKHYPAPANEVPHADMPIQVQTPCTNREILFLQSASKRLDRRIPALESQRGMFGLSTGIRTFDPAVRVDETTGLNYFINRDTVYFYTGTASRLGYETTLLDPDIMKSLEEKFSFTELKSTVICGHIDTIYLLKKKTGGIIPK